MSYIDSSKTSLKYYMDTVLSATPEKVSVENKKNNETSAVQLYNSSQSLGYSTEVEKTAVKKGINVEELTKKYKKNPADVLSVIGIEFDESQIKELKSLLTNEKHLEAFLNIAEKENLNADDIMAGVRKSKDFKNSNFFKRSWNVLRKEFKEGIDEAIELAKSEYVYYTDKLGTHMSEIRKEREDFTSDGLADIADIITGNAEIKDETMHFVKHESQPGEKTYTENDVLKSAEFMSKKPEKAENFVQNAQELESIKDENGKMKYKGSTIVNVDVRMINNEELAPTMMKTAKKSDMTDEYLENITSNLEKNPLMQNAIEFSLNAKNTDGTDRFTAGSINGESNHLVDKNGNYCSDYTKNLEQLSQYGNLSSDNIVTIAGNVTTHPEIKNEIIAKIENGTMSGSEIAQYSSQCAQQAENNGYSYEAASSGTNYSSNNTQSNSQTASSTGTNKNKQTNTPANKFRKVNIAQVKSAEQLTAESETINKETENDKIVINGREYDERKVYDKLYKQFGTITDKVIVLMQKDKRFIDVLKKYNGNKTIIQAYIDNPGLLAKINSKGALSNSERADILKLCTDSGSTNVMLAALDGSSVSRALKITKQSQFTNSKQETLSILISGGKNDSEKQQELNQLYGIC